MMISVFPNAMTDEIAVSTYAAKLFLEGKDPYSNANMAPVFNSFFIMGVMFQEYGKKRLSILFLILSAITDYPAPVEDVGKKLEVNT